MKQKLIIAALIAVLLATVLIMVSSGVKEPNEYIPPETDNSTDTAPDPETQAPPVTDPPETEPPYISEIDFAELQAVNEDIYGWIKIPGTTVDLPIFRYEGEDQNFYLEHDINKQYDPVGVLYTQTYNTRTFNDKMTVIYGHNLVMNTMFGDLIKYSDKAFFDEHKTMTIYLEHTKKEYTLVMARPFDDRHLLYYWPLAEEDSLQRFIDEVIDYSNPYAVYAEDVEVTADDRLVVLSTCYYTVNNMRYLVIWKETAVE